MGGGIPFVSFLGMILEPRTYSFLKESGRMFSLQYNITGGYD